MSARGARWRRTPTVITRYHLAEETVMTRMIVLLGAALAATTAPALAENYISYPAPVPLPLPHSVPTGPLVAIPPYDHPFVVRTYTTPPEQPFYNAPPYAVVAPY